MSGQLSLWGAGQFLTMSFSALTEIPNSYFLALIKETAPTPYISGAELDEPLVGSYTRMEIPNTIDYWTNTGQIQVISLQQDITFPTATADWGMIRHWAICNSDVDGYVYMTGTMDTPLNVFSGDVAVVPAGNITVSLGPFFSSGTS